MTTRPLWILRLVLLVQASMAISCGGDDGTTTFTVSTSAPEGGAIAPTSATVASGATTTFTVTPSTGYHISSVTGCGGSLSANTYATGAIAADCTIAATFALNSYTVAATAGANGAITPASQTVTHGASTRFTVTPDGGYEISGVTGCNGSLSGNTYTTGPVTVDCAVTASFALVAVGSIIDVHGVVLFDGLPVAGVAVGIPGVGSTSSAEDGTFTLAGVEVPYDIGVSVPSSGRAVFYQGIRSAAPRLPVLSVPTPKALATVSGTLTGGESYPQPADHDTEVCLQIDTSLGAPGAPGHSPDDAPGSYSVGGYWWGTETIGAALLGVQVARDAATGLPTDYVAYGKIDSLTLTAGETITDQVLPLAPVTEATLSGSVVVPEGYAVARKSVQLGCLGLLDDDGTASSFSYTTPGIAGVDLVLDVEAASATAGVHARLAGVAPGATGVTVSLPAAAEPLAPADQATDVSSETPFSWTGIPGGTVALAFASYLSPEEWSLLVVTEGESLTLPDTALVGLAIPPETILSWKVGAIAPLSMDDIVARGTLEPASSGWSESVSNARYLMTAP